MQAVILAAGKGSRIYPMSVTKPKPLINVANKPVLEHILDQMLGLVSSVILVVGYKKDHIIEHLGDNYKGIKIQYVVQEEQLGTGHAVLTAKNLVTEKFLVLNGDDLFSRVDMKSISKYDNCILVKHKKDPSAFGVVKVNDGFVQDIIEKPKEFISSLVSTGMYCFTPKVFDILQNLTPSIRGEYELTDAAKVLAYDQKLHYEESQGFWIPVGYPWHILDATQILLEEKDHVSIKGTVSQGVTISGSIDIGEGTFVGKDAVLQGNIIIGKNCHIGPGVVIKGFSAIGDNSIIEKDVALQNAIIGQNCTVHEDCVLKDSVLGDGVDLHKGVKIENWSMNGTVKVKSNGKVFDSGREKLGAFIADECSVHRQLECGECVSPHEDSSMSITKHI